MLVGQVSLLGWEHQQQTGKAAQGNCSHLFAPFSNGKRGGRRLEIMLQFTLMKTRANNTKDTHYESAGLKFSEGALVGLLSRWSRLVFFTRKCAFIHFICCIVISHKKPIWFRFCLLVDATRLRAPLFSLPPAVDMTSQRRYFEYSSLDHGKIVSRT